MPERLELPTGRIRQRVPMTSAVKVGGERLYRRAHRGESVETPEREVEVYRAELLRHEGDSAEFEIECSTGTYVRTLIETLGDAYCELLRRTPWVRFVSRPRAASRWRSKRRWSSCRSGSSMRTRRSALRTGARCPPPRRPEGPLRLTHEGRLLAVARRTGTTCGPKSCSHRAVGTTSLGAPVKGFPAAYSMKIRVTQLADAERRSRQVAIGVFDGVHVGHRQVIDGADTVLTFEPHPCACFIPTRRRS